MDKEEIKSIVSQAKKEKSILYVKGYKSSSGTVADYKIDMSEKQSYRELVWESLEVLKSYDDFPNDLNEDDGISAIGEMRESFEAFLKGESKPSERKYTLTESDEGYATRDDKPELVVLTQPKIVEYTVKEKPESKPRQHKNDVTRAKAILRSMLPVSKFVSELHLSPEKIEGVEVLPKN